VTKVFANDQMEILLGAKTGFNMLTHLRFFPDKRAELAINMVTHWGGVVAKQTGVDEGGNPIQTLLTPVEVVQRAVEISDLLHQEIEKREWLVVLPPYADLEEDITATAGFVKK
jgi:hypothetical protein